MGSHSGHSTRSGIDGHGSYDGGSSRMKVATAFATISIASTDATTITHPNPTQASIKQESQMVGGLPVHGPWGLTRCMDEACSGCCACLLVCFLVASPLLS